MEHVIDALLRVVSAHGAEPAVSDESSTFTYAGLLAYAECVAANMKAKGVAFGDRVIVEIPRCKEYAGCLLACWIMGAVAIPLSDDYPEERLAYIKKDSAYRLSINDDFIASMDTTLTTEPVVAAMDAEGVVIYTSGSTGNPKGVIHTFASMAAVAERNAARNRSEEDEVEKNNLFGLVAPFTFVVGTGLFLAGITLAKHIFIVPDAVRKDPYQLAKYYDDNQIESSFVPPRMVDFMLKHNRSLKAISVGSERITNLYFNDDPIVMNGYGSTELFGGVLYFKIDKPYENTPIGKPFGQEKVYVLDENDHEAEVGELCVSGHVAKGYLNREEETKKSFVANPFFAQDGFPRMFRTGDLVQRLPDGNLVFIERKDWMIKINGQRVEPLEVESTIRRFPGVREAAVRDFTAKNGITYLAAYYIAGDDVTEEALRGHCKANLTSYMVPTFYIRMVSFPINPNGKLDRKNLPEPDISSFKREYAAPENKIEAAIADAFETVLQCGKIGRNDDFFLLGGDSVKVIETVNALEDLPLSSEMFFAGKTPAGIARLLENGGDGEIPFDRTEKPAYPLTSSQLGIYLAMVERPGSLMYNNPVSIPLDDTVDVAKLIAAVEKAVGNHRAYQCRIDTVGGVPCMIPTHAEFSVPLQKVTDIGEALPRFVRPFDLSGGELIRAAVFQNGAEKVLALDAHHIVFDGTTLAVLLGEIGRAYEGKDLFEEKTSAFDLSSYEDALRQSEAYADAKRYYETVFDGLEISNDMLPDFEDRGEASQDTVDRLLSLDREALLKFLKGNDLSENSFLLAVFSFVLAGFNGTEKSLVCVGESGRHTSMTFNTAGMLVRTIALPVVTEGENDVVRFVKKIQKSFRESVKNDVYPFGELASRYGLANDFSFVYQNDAFSALTLSGKKYPVKGIQNPDAINKMTLMAFLGDDGFRLSFRYRSDLFRRGIIESFADAYVSAARDFLAKETLREVRLLSRQGVERLESFHGETLPLTDEKTVPQAFEDRVHSAPERDFVVFRDRRYTYGEAGKITDKIAARLQSLGLGANDVVAVLIPRNEWMLLAVYGVTKAGCAYEPLDATYPEERLSFMVKNADAKVLITTRELQDKIAGFKGTVLLTEDVASWPDALPTPVRNQPDDLFVLLYTSGTTGTPKGVMLTHGNVIALSALNRHMYAIDENAVNACYASFGFDACTQDLITFPPRGACVHIVPEEMRLNLSEVDRYYIENRITHAVMTTQVGRQYALMTKSPYLKYVAVGGEALVPMDTTGFTFDFYNLYGPSECSVYVTGTKVRGDEYRVPIGKVMPNVKCYVVDAHLNRLPVGEPGELLVAGPQVGKGYLNNPEKTAQSFIKNPFSEEEGYQKAYKTGDIVRFLPDGSLDFVGRRDGQVKVRGFRVELTEVEEIIRRFEGVTDATVAAFDDPAGGKFLAAYVVSDVPLNVERLNAFIQTEKPPYMVPAVTMQIDRIPLNQNHKVNRRALPKPERKAAELLPPQNETQRKILDVVKETLGLSEVGINTDFYEAGLSSISVIRLNVALEDVFGIPFTVSDIRAHGTAEKLAEFVDNAARETQYEMRADYPLTQTQMGIYVECAAAPGALTYNIPILCKLGEGIDPLRFRAAVVAALDAHPYVKTTLFADAQGNVRARRNDGIAAEVSLLTCETCPTQAELVRPFVLLGAPLYRLAVYQTPGGNYFFMDFHHIVSDGASENIFLADVGKAYAGLPVKAERFTGFEAALEEEAARQTPRYAEAKAYYDSVFKGCDPDCLPPKSAGKGQGGSASVVRQAETRADRVALFCRKNKCTPNAFFNAVFGFVFARFSNVDDAVFTTIYNGRSDSRLSGSMAMLVKTLPVLVHTAGNGNVADAVRETQEQLLGNMSNDVYSFAEISAAYGIKANVIFAYQGDEFPFDSLAGERVEMIPVQPTAAKAPLTVNVYLKDGRYRFVIDYRREYYDEAFVNAFADAFDTALGDFTEKKKTASVSLLSPAAQALIDKTNATEHPFENVPVHRLFEAQAAAHPDTVAVICEGRTYTYASLNAAANRAAHRLASLGVKKDDVIGLLLPRTEELSVAELAVLKAGGAFLGLLPEYPDDRIEYCLTDAHSPIVITTEALKQSRRSLLEGAKPFRTVTTAELTADGPEDGLAPNIPTDSLAYCIYTSGSTGKPKGVMIEHRNLVNLAQTSGFVYDWFYGSKSGQTSLALSSISFDVSVFEHLLMLLNGKTVCLATEREIHNPMLLADVIRENRVDNLMATPSMLTNLLSIAEFRPVMANVSFVTVGAEVFPAALYDTLKQLNPAMTVINGYGPSECTITTCAKKLESSDRITIGGPVVNTKLFVMDAFGNVLPPYASGELIICGGLVGRGYINLPEKTRDAFFTFRGMPAYRSGDVVRMNADGEIEFFGRRDNQVKLRGFRIELDEIEKCICAYPGIAQSKVIVRNNGSEDYLAGFFTADRTVDVEALTTHMKASLTYYMVPDVLMQLEQMPLTPSGKIDKKALPEIKKEKKKTGRKAPKKSLEQQICEICAEALAQDEFFADDNFFEMGGTSLTASKVTMQLMARGLKVEYQDVFDNPTPESLAAFIERAGGTAGPEAPGATDTDAGIVSDYPEQLKYNTLQYAGEVKREPLGNVLLTGAVGFLGIHVLRELIDAHEGNIICLLRRGSFDTPQKRLKSMLIYYFGRAFDEEMNDRVRVVEADITDNDLPRSLAAYAFDTVINCAACVKHYAADDILERINVHGVENLIAVATQRNARMIQISTVSIPGAHTDETWKRKLKMYENCLFVVDDMGNKYSKSKYHAELRMLEAIKNGMRGKIIRVGNLMGRYSDGEFQINFNTNAFLNAMRGFATIGKSPISHATDPMSFSPIDMTARAIVLLAGTNDMFTVFNADSRFIFDEWQLIEAANRCGVKITPVPDEEYYADYHRMLGDPKVNARLQGLVTNDRPDIHGVENDNKFTTNVLYRLGFSWPLPSEDYLRRALESLLTLDYFEPDAE